MLADIAYGKIGKFWSVVEMINTDDEIDADRVTFWLRLHHIEESLKMLLVLRIIYEAILYLEHYHSSQIILCFQISHMEQLTI